ncbi:MAG: RluA family pseudouridine synthase [Planctomycetota bacterium]|nr:RluA family pseudouridine synthase [Planctomycetota bacterium]MDA1113117.1 RluA family pseudouridine synthase [Planctomycetota bacterium]
MVKLDVLYVDNHVLVVVKPACQPIVPDDSGDLSLLDQAKQWVKEEFNKPGDVFLGVVHRLDRPVSGVVVFARTSKGASRLSAAWQRHEVQKTYLAWSCAEPKQGSAQEGEWRQWLWKDRSRNRVTIGKREGAKEAITLWKVLEVNSRGTLLLLQPKTGRAHQLRVACAAAGLALAGDLKYGADQPLINQSVGLHALSLEFKHPTKEDVLCFTAPPPSWAIGESGREVRG